MRGMTLQEGNKKKPKTKRKENNGDFPSRLMSHSFGWSSSENKSTKDLNKIIITESQLSCLKPIKHLKKKKKKKSISINFFSHIFKCIRHKHLNPSYHIMTALYPSHDISFKMLHYNYYIKCRTSIWVLNTYLKGYKDIYLWGKLIKKNKNSRRAWQNTDRVPSGCGEVENRDTWGWFGYLQVKSVCRRSHF